MEKDEIEFLQKAVEYCVKNQINFGMIYDGCENSSANLLLKINELNGCLNMNRRDFVYSEEEEVKTVDGFKAKILKVEEVIYFIKDENGFSYYTSGRQIMKRSGKILKIA